MNALATCISLDAKIKSLNSLKYLTAEQAIEKILNSVKSNALKQELKKWYLFGLSEAGNGLAKLSPEELGCFMDKLPDIALVLYNYYHSTDDTAKV